MTVTIWHNPKCATSRKVLETIRRKGVEPQVVEYVKTPPSAAEIRAALKEMGIKPRDLLRRRGTPYEALGLDNPKLDEAALIAAMTPDPDRAPCRAQPQRHSALPAAGAGLGDIYFSDAPRRGGAARSFRARRTQSHAQESRTIQRGC